MLRHIFSLISSHLPVTICVTVAGLTPTNEVAARFWLPFISQYSPSRTRIISFSSFVIMLCSTKN